MNKSDIVLEFPNETEKKKIMDQYKLASALVEENTIPRNQSESQVSKVESVGEEMSEDRG